MSSAAARAAPVGLRHRQLELDAVGAFVSAMSSATS